MVNEEQLCLSCGMCCDGSLFDNVKLAPGEGVAPLKDLGLPVKLSRAQVPIPFFRQPCRALCGDLKCQVYSDRPQQCRTFECGVFKAARSGRITCEAALRLVKQGRRRADRVRKLLRKMGETDEKEAIGSRFRRVQRRLQAGLIEASAAGIFSELGLAMHQLDMLAHDSFYTQEDAL